MEQFEHDKGGKSGEADTEYSRYAGEADARGSSMVSKHLAAKNEEAKNNAMLDLQRAMPEVNKKIILQALESCNWDPRRSFQALVAFQNSTGLAGGKKDVKEGKEKEKKEKEKSSKKRKKGHKRKHSERSDDDSDATSASSGSESESGGDSDDSEEYRKKRKEKSRKKDKKEKKDKAKKSKRGKDKSKGRDKDKEKEKGMQVPMKIGSCDDTYGKFGIIRQTDIHNKTPEFIIWAQDVKNMSIEGLSKWEEKDLFSEYVEDYNTATLPGEKYYNYELWCEKERMEAIKRGGIPQDEKTTFNDEEERKRELQQQRLKEKNAEVARLRKTMVQSGMAADMRAQEELRQQMELHYKTGNVQAARQIAERLQPDLV